MRRFVFTPLLCLSAALVLTTPAKAQRATFPGRLPSLGWPGMTTDDVARMNAASARLYEGRSIGNVERWRSPRSADAGEVTLTRAFDWHGMPCRTLDYTIRFEVQRGSPDHYVMTWCRIPDGSWKIVEVPPSG
jgi:surface antigen